MRFEYLIFVALFFSRNVLSCLFQLCYLFCVYKVTIVYVTVVQALDTLGSTKWRVNTKVLSVIDRIWASGGCIADLVDREDVRLSGKKFSFKVLRKVVCFYYCLCLSCCRFQYQKNQIQMIQRKLRNGGGQLEVSRKKMQKGTLNGVIQNSS